MAGKSIISRLYRQAKDGHRLSISLMVSPIRNASGRVVGASKIAGDITERKRLEALLSSIVACSDDAIISTNLDGSITSWNPAAERMFGFTSAEVLGKSIRLVIPPELQDEEDFVLSRIRGGGQVDHFETVRQTKDGRRLNISLTVSPIRDVHGNVIGASKIARDVTEKKKLEQDRLVALRRLSESLAGRDEFIAVAAHELRNPLNGLTLLMRLLEKTLAEAGSSQRNLAERSKSQLGRLSSLVDRLLDVTRIRFGTFDLYRQTFDLNDLVREVAGRTEYSGASFSVRLGPPIMGNWDRLRIDQVVTNLVTNAIKYGMEKPVLIAASEDSDHAIISVRDHGKGLSPEDQARIFERFGPVGERSHNRGLGMGLWITRQIVEAHGGTINVESELGQGSVFTVRLPLAQ
jgi:PAS domain S-box-containing protein